jgi:hypothetical protein
MLRTLSGFCGASVEARVFLYPRLHPSRIFDVFERVLLGQQSMEVTLAGMGLTYFPREILQCTMLKVGALALQILALLFYCMARTPRFRNRIPLTLFLLQKLDISHNAFRAMPPIISLLLTRITKVTSTASLDQPFNITSSETCRNNFLLPLVNLFG